jgi:phytoene dehydrogenase-like protein
MADYDAIVVGAGHNGLVCALYLQRAGWRVAVLEANDEIGGGLRSGEVTRVGFCHDRYATNLGVFAASPIYQELKGDFDAHGVTLLRSDKPYASLHDRRALRIYTDVERTQAEFAALSERDVAGWRQLTAFYRRIAPILLPLFFAELSSAALLSQAAKMLGCGVGDVMRMLRLLYQSSGAFSGAFFGSAAARGLIEAWAYHLDFAPDVMGGAVFGFIPALSSHLNGMPIVEGGTGRIATALAAMLDAAGAKLITKAEVTRIVVRNGTAVAVRTRSGEEISATRAIIANVTPPKLFGRLVAADDIDQRFLRRVERYRYGPGTFIIHLALERMPRWTAADDLAGFSYVHLNAGRAEIADTYRHSLQGLLPARPMLVVSQPTAIDPSRAPAGRHVMRVHVRTVPANIAGDAAGTITAGSWRQAKGPFAERVLNLVAEHAPDLRSCITGIAVESPDEIERENPNFVGGDCVSGSHQLDQNFFCRPLFGWSGYTTPLAQLYMIGASTWPGGGVNAASGYILARKLLRAKAAH